MKQSLTTCDSFTAASVGLVVEYKFPVWSVINYPRLLPRILLIGLEVVLSWSLAAPQIKH